MCIAEQIPNDVSRKHPSLWIIRAQEFDRAEPVLLILPVCLQIMIAVRSRNRQISQFSVLPCQNSRYKSLVGWILHV
jgi:hypothetical protein